MSIRDIKMVFDSLLTGLLFFWHSEGVERKSFGKKMITSLPWIDDYTHHRTWCHAVPPGDCVSPNNPSAWTMGAPWGLALGQENAGWTKFSSIPLKTWVSDHRCQDMVRSHGGLTAVAEGNKNLQVSRWFFPVSYDLWDTLRDCPSLPLWIEGKLIPPVWEKPHHFLLTFRHQRESFPASQYAVLHRAKHNLSVTLSLCGFLTLADCFPCSCSAICGLQVKATSP